METSKFEKRRGRVKKKVEALRNGLDATPSPSSSVSEGLDMFPDSPLHPGFQLSPDFRPRASSNASSCGRLSPIPAVESDNQVPPISPWNHHGGGGGDFPGPNLFHTPPGGGGGMDRYGAEQLAGNLAEGMKIGEGGFLTADCRPPSHHQLAAMGNNGYSLGNAYPPGYEEFHARFTDSGKLTGGMARSPQRMLVPQPAHHELPTSYNLGNLPQGCHIHRQQPCTCHIDGLQQQQQCRRDVSINLSELKGEKH